MELIAQRNTYTLASRVTQGDRPIHIDSGIKYVAQLFLIFWSHQLHIWNCAHKSYIKHTMLSRTIFTNNSGTIHCEYHMQVLHTNVMDNLVIGTLHKC